MAAGMLIAAALWSPTLAQQPGPPPGAGDRTLRDELPGVKGRSNEIERVKRDAEKPEKKPEETFPQIKEDFERIQLVNSNVLQAPAPGSAPDYGRMAEAAAEIKQRAARLKTHLFGAEPGKQPKEKEDKSQPELKSLLSALDAAISAFVNSPIFQNTKVVNPEDSAKAKRDLEDVIKLSGKIGKEAARLKKEGGG
jgi:hypothetical protein